MIGHSTGGLIAQKIAGEGVAAVTVSIDNAPFKGVLPLPASSLKSAAPVLTNPANMGRGVSLTLEQFQYGWVNALGEDEGRRLYESSTSRRRASPSSRRRSRTSTRSAAIRRSTRRIPSRGPLCSSAARRTTPSRRRSSMPATRSRRSTTRSHRGDHHPRPWALTDDRLGLARSRRRGARVRPAFRRVGCAPAGR